MNDRIALLLLALALPSLAAASGAQAKEGQTKEGQAKESPATKPSSPSAPANTTPGPSHHSNSSARFSQDDAREALRKGKVMPLTAILEIVAKRQPGTVIAVDLETKHGRLIYEIDVITEDGRRRELRLDARGGEILAVEDE